MSSKSRALLAYLAVEADRFHSRDFLTAMFWADNAPQSAQANLRNVLSNLRKILKGDSEKKPYLTITRDSVLFNLDSQSSVDVLEFNRLLGSILPLDDQQFSRRTELVFLTNEITVLQRIAELNRGMFLDGFSLPDCPEFDEWQIIKREHFNRQAVRALHSLAENLAARGEYTRALGYAQRQIELEPWMEEAHQQVMHLLYMEGQRSLALQQFEVCRKLLLDGLGVEPGDATRQLYQQIKSGIITPVRKFPGFLTGESRLADQKRIFVARNEELCKLEQALNLTIAGKGQVRLVAGSAGQGKTALVLEFIRRSLKAHHNLVAVMGNCQAYFGKGDPFQPFREILEMISGDVEIHWSTGRLDTEAALRCWLLTPVTAQVLAEKGPVLLNYLVDGQAVLERVNQTVIGGNEWISRLASLVYNSNRADIPVLDQEGLFHQYFNVIQQVSHTTPLLIFLDDLQWADTSSLSLLLSLGKKITASRILIVGAFRSESVEKGENQVGQDYSRHPFAQVINEFQLMFGDVVINLDTVEDQSIVNEYLDSEPNRFESEFREILFRRTHGHPLFMIELLRGMQERGEISKNPQGLWVASPELNWDLLSRRIEAVVRERVQIIPGELREILEVASIGGERFSVETLAEVIDSEPRKVLQVLRGEMERPSALLLMDSRQKEGEDFQIFLRFKHSLFHQYIYMHTEKAYRSYLHNRYAAVLEKQYHHSPDLVMPQLAIHYREAGESRKAAECYYLAGTYAERIPAVSVAEESFQNALELIPEDQLLNRYTVLQALELLYHRIGERQSQEKTLAKLSSVSENLAEAYRMQVKLRYADYALVRWDHQDLYAKAMEVVAWAGEQVKSPISLRPELYEGPGMSGNDRLCPVIPDPGRLEVQGLFFLGAYYSGIYYADEETSQPRLKNAIPIMEKALKLAQSRGYTDLEMQTWRSLSIMRLGENADLAEDAARKALVLARSLADHYNESGILNALGLALSVKKEYVGGYHCHTRAKRLCREIGNRLDEGWSVHHLAQFYQLCGRLDLLLDDLLEMHEYARKLRHAYLQGWSGFVIAHHYYLSGDYSNAMVFAQDTLELIREKRFVGQPLETTLAIIGGIFEKLGECEMAEKYYRDAERIMRVAEEDGEGNTSVFLHLPLAGLARLAFQQAKLDQSVEFVNQFHPLLRNIGIFENGMVVCSYLTAYRILSACKDARAVSLLEEAVEKVNATAELIKDDHWQSMFYERNQYNQEVMNEWQKLVAH